jgi:hypothetical protein
MKRRRFLQLAAGTAAGAIVQASPAFASQWSLRVASVVRDSAPAIVVLPGIVPVEKYAPSLAVSGWMDSDGLIHAMIERPHRLSYPQIEFSSLLPGRRYRMRLMNATDSDVSVHLPGSRVELMRVERAPVAGIHSNSIRLKRFSVVDADVIV